MSNPLMVSSCTISQDIHSHSAWHGVIRGLVAEKYLRGIKTPYQYLLRAGECTIGNETDYYVSFVLPDLSIKHQPFIITTTPEGWYYENAGSGGPYQFETIDDVLHLIMHCNQEDCVPLTKLR